MKELDLSWEQFVKDYTSNRISVQVDKNKGHSIMSGPLAPSNWRFMIKVVLFLAMVSIPAAIVLLFFVKWWIPLILIVVSFMLNKAVRGESAKAVIETAIKDEQFYYSAKISKVLFTVGQ